MSLSEAIESELQGANIRIEGLSTGALHLLYPFAAPASPIADAPVPMWRLAPEPRPHVQTRAASPIRVYLPSIAKGLEQESDELSAPPPVRANSADVVGVSPRSLVPARPRPREAFVQTTARYQPPLVRPSRGQARRQEDSK